MTVTTTNVLSGPYYPNGAALSFPFNFKVFDKSDLRVFDVSSGAEVDFDPSLYSASISTNGGAVIFAAPPAAGAVLYIALDPSFTNNISFGVEESFFPQSHNEGFDRSALRDQVLKSAADRAFTLPLTPEGRQSITGKFPTTDASGKPVFASGTGSDPALRGDLARMSGVSLIGLDPTTAFGFGSLGNYLTDGVIRVAGYLKRGSDPATSAANAIKLAFLLGLCVARNKVLLIDSGDWYIDGGIQCLAGLVRISCEGTVYTNCTGPFITMKAIGGSAVTINNWFICGGTFKNTNGGVQRESAIIKILGDGAFISFAIFSNVEGYGFYQLFDNAAGHFTSSFGEEGLMNHGLMECCVSHWSGSLNAKWLMRHRTGSGTGWIYRGNRDDVAVGSDPDYLDPVGAELKGYPAVVRIEAGGLANCVVSDILFDGHVVGKFSGAVSVDGNCVYNSNLAVTPATQIDAQAIHGIFYDPPLAGSTPAINISQAPVNVGGGLDVALDLPYVTGSTVYAQGWGEARGGRYNEQMAGPGAQSVPLCEVQIFPQSSCLVECIVTGVVFGIAGGGLRKRTYAIRHDGSTVTVTEIAAQAVVNPAGLSASFFDITTSVNVDKVTFNVAYSATAGGSKLAAQYQVLGGAWRTRRLN